eukprot:g7285.t1
MDATGGAGMEQIDSNTLSLARSVTALQQRGDAAAEVGALTRAVKCYSEAVEADPHDDTGRLDLLLAARSSVLRKQGRDAEAATDVRRIASVQAVAATAAEAGAGSGKGGAAVDANVALVSEAAMRAAASWRSAGTGSQAAVAPDPSAPLPQLRLQLACVQVAGRGGGQGAGAGGDDCPILGAALCVLGQPQPAAVVASTAVRLVKISRATLLRAFDFHANHVAHLPSNADQAALQSAIAGASAAAATRRRLARAAGQRLRFLTQRFTTALAAQLRVCGHAGEARALEERALVTQRVAAAAVAAFTGVGSGAAQDALPFKRMASDMANPHTTHGLTSALAAAGVTARHAEGEVTRRAVGTGARARGAQAAEGEADQEKRAKNEKKKKKKKAGDANATSAAVASAAATMAAAAELRGREALIVPPADDFYATLTLPPASRFSPSRGLGAPSAEAAGAAAGRPTYDAAAIGAVHCRRRDAASLFRSHVRQSAGRARAAALALSVGFLRLSTTQLLSVTDIFTQIVIFTVAGCAAAYGVAGVLACRVIRTKSLLLKYLCVPPLSAFVGAAIGFFLGFPTAVLIAGIYASIPTSVASDFAAALGLAQSALIIYFHLGRGESLAHTFR